MAKQLPENIFLQGIFQPLSEEFDVKDASVVGNVPKELNGTLLRNGPNPQYVYSKNYHLFEGDGMIHAMTFNNDQVSYKNRWIRTEKFLLEQKAGRSLFGGMRDFMACDESVQSASRNTANTNVVWHADKLLALNEGAPPMAMDVHNLATQGIYDFNRELQRSMMAHPKIDPLTGELLFYSYFSSSLDFIYFIANKAGQITHKEKITMPYISLMHDFAVTKNFTIFPLFPLTWDFQRIMRRETIFKWEPNLNSRFAIVPRYGTHKQVIWFEDAACLAMHVVNAYEEGENIILEMGVIDDIPEDVIAFADDAVTYTTYYTRWIFNLQTKKVIKQRLDNINMEFPRIDERWMGNKYQHAYMASTLNKQLPKNFFDSITHYDLTTDKKQTHDFGAHSIALEPVFVPRSASSAEGDGFLLSYAYREKENRSDLIILDALHVDDEPLAIIQLPHRVPYGFHGCWIPAE